ncbi:SUMF1/EgtB/PvdO family nonheme iron enzyme [Streptomyces sp. NPDC001380]|uniref:SUMF1/EgtB/PvdO family nonheme iron enzyme n=1 Tax=Streptomyces sp. NPDC001380 TaxID=3364566 RepID=UPI0036D08AC5
MATVERWSGREVRALREAKRMSIRAFAAHLGVSDRMISKWEAGGEAIRPRPVNQAALDTSLAQSAPEVHARFSALADTRLGDIPKPQAEESPGPGACHQIRHHGDGKLMSLVDGGVFLCGPENQPVHLPAYYIDVFPTTNADYARFVTATGHRPPLHWDGGHVPDELCDHPVVYVTWRDATAYAAWAGKALPSSQQWEKAARGTAGRIYPWGDQPTPAKCNVREGGLGRTTPVGRYHSGVSPFEVYDMCGNTWEWCSTETTAGRHELKGSAFTSPFSRAAPATFNDASADMYDDDTGFRCVAPVTGSGRLPIGVPTQKQTVDSIQQSSTSSR